VSVIIKSVSVRVRMPRVYYIHEITCVRISVICIPLRKFLFLEMATNEEVDCDGERYDKDDKQTYRDFL